MSHEVPQHLKDLIVHFVQIYNAVTDIELDLNQDPKLSFMPLDNYEHKREAAHYFLLAAALSDNQLTGNPRNVRLLLDHLWVVFEGKLYTIVNPVEFKQEVNRFEQKTKNFDKLGEAKDEIPEVLCSVNRFVEKKARGDLIDYTAKLIQKGRKPQDFADSLSYSVKRMNKQHKSKCWLYLRWMVRPAPDLGLFSFNPKDLMVSLTTPKLRVYVALGLSDNENLPFVLNSKNKPDSWWESTLEFDADAERLTLFACSLFPDDPAIIDFPFFIVGTWLEYSDLTPISLERSLRFFIKKQEELHQPLMRYLTVVYHYNRIGERIMPGAFSPLETEVYDFLRKKQVVAYYEFMEFYLSQTGSNASLTYKPDFLLPQFTSNERKVLLEPHGIRDNFKEFLDKLSIFRKHYGKYFCLILIVPDDFIEAINEFDSQHDSYDLVWKRSDYKIQFENFRSS